MFYIQNVTKLIKTHLLTIGSQHEFVIIPHTTITQQIEHKADCGACQSLWILDITKFDYIVCDSL